MKNFNDTIGNRTRGLPACSAVPQPTAPPRAIWNNRYIKCRMRQGVHKCWVPDRPRANKFCTGVPQYFASQVRNLRLLSQVQLLDFCRICARGVGACGEWDSLTQAGVQWRTVCEHCNELSGSLKDREFPLFLLVNEHRLFNPLSPELNPICYLLALLAHHFLHVSRIWVKLLTIRLLMSYIYIWSTYS